MAERAVSGTKSSAKSWTEVRAKRAPREDRVAEHRARMESEVRAYRLREVRKEQGLTQTELAERMHVKQPTVSELEGGELERAGPVHDQGLRGSSWRHGGDRRGLRRSPTRARLKPC
jgi:DNA-binding XRE family transcriptional regulator